MRLFLSLLPGLMFAQAVTQNYSYSISTVAGTNWTGDGRAATGAHLLRARGIAVAQDGTLFISDSADHRVRRISPAGVIDTVAGLGRPGFAGDDELAAKTPLNQPYGLAVDPQGNLFIADLGNGRIRKLRPDGRLVTVAGGGDLTPDPDRGSIPALDARLKAPRGIAVDRLGNLYIADFNAHRILQVTPGGMLSVIAGTGQQEDAGIEEDRKPALRSGFSFPTAVALDSRGALYIADSTSSVLRKLEQGFVSRVRDRFQAVLTLSGLVTGLALDVQDRLYMCIGDEVTIVHPNGVVETLRIPGYALGITPQMQIYTAADDQVLKHTGATPLVIAGTTRGPGAGDGFDKARWRFASPAGVVRDMGGHTLISDRVNRRIRRLSPAGELTTVTQRLQKPGPIALDPQSRLHVGDGNKIYRVDLSGGTSKIFEGPFPNQDVAGITFDRSGNLFFSMGERVHRITPEGSVSAQAGGGNNPNDGPAYLTALGMPTGLDFDSEGVLHFIESATGKIRKLQNSRVTTVAGAAFPGACSLRFGRDDSMYITDCQTNHRVVRMWLDGRWIPIAGSGYPAAGAESGNALAEPLHTPSDAFPLPDGTVLVAEAGNDRIRLLTPEVEDIPIRPPDELKYPPVAVRHAATLAPSDVAPGQLVYVGMTGINVTNGVTFSGQPGTVLSAAEGQLTVRLPMSVVPGPVEIAVTEGKAVKGKAVLTAVTACPGILTAQGGRGQALGLNEDGTLNSAAHPAGRGAIVTVYLTGEGDNVTAPKVRIGGYDADVVWHGRAPDLPGLYQVNVRTPGGFSPSGVVTLEMMVNGAPTQSGVTIVSK